VLGDMLELGEEAAEFHEVTGMYAARHSMDLILCVGPNSEHMHRGAETVRKGCSYHFEEQDDLLRLLPELVRDGDTILVKASRGLHLERTVAALERL